MITASQILAHLWGDYILQSDWMAQNKTKAHWPAFIHAFLYSLCFLPFLWRSIGMVPYPEFFWRYGPAWQTLHQSFEIRLLPWCVIFGTHFLIDRYRLARYVVWLKNQMGPKKFWYRSIAGGVPHWTDQSDKIATPDSVDDYYIFYAPTPPLWACPTGYPPTAPAWMATWLLIIADNILHITINGLALKYL